MQALWTAVAIATTMLQPVSIERLLIGSWSGTLQYRDYRSDKQVTLPTNLEITGGGSGPLTFAYTYDDGPGKTVRSQDRITIDVSRDTYRVQSVDGDYDATFAITERRGDDSSAGFLLVGKGEENGAVVDLRIRYVMTPTTLQMTRESRRAGGEWLVRNEYRLSRPPR
jgi:hypothetical protein